LTELFKCNRCGELVSYRIEVTYEPLGSIKHMCDACYRATFNQ